MPARLSRRQFGLASVALGTAWLLEPASGQGYRRYPAVVPGTGVRVARTGDDFEEQNWAYFPQHPKSSWNIDENVREPGSHSTNGRWAEGAKRGTPDLVRRVATPSGGIEGSQGAMLFQTLRSGIPGTLTYQQQQDDLLHNTQALSGTLPVAWSPNVICRVHVPPTKYWEQRDGATFGFRTGLVAHEEYWPGIFLHMERKPTDGKQGPLVRAWVRADDHGRDMPSLTFEPESWITMGISHTPDGAVHFFLRPGIEELTKDDCVGSYFCYGWRAHTFQNFFFNVINMDDGRSVSTPWIVDDAFLFAATPPANKVRMAGGQKAAPAPATTSAAPATAAAPAAPELKTLSR